MGYFYIALVTDSIRRLPIYFMFSKYWYLFRVTVFDFVFDKKYDNRRILAFTCPTVLILPTYAGRISEPASCEFRKRKYLGSRRRRRRSLVVVQDFKRYLMISKSGPGVGTLSGGPGRRHLARFWKTRRVVEQNMSRALVLAGSLVLFARIL